MLLWSLRNFWNLGILNIPYSTVLGYGSSTYPYTEKAQHTLKFRAIFLWVWLRHKSKPWKIICKSEQNLPEQFSQSVKCSVEWAVKYIQYVDDLLNSIKYTVFGSRTAGRLWSSVHHTVVRSGSSSALHTRAELFVQSYSYSWSDRIASSTRADQIAGFMCDGPLAPCARAAVRAAPSAAAPGSLPLRNGAQWGRYECVLFLYCTFYITLLYCNKWVLQTNSWQYNHLRLRNRT